MSSGLEQIPAGELNHEHQSASSSADFYLDGAERQAPTDPLVGLPLSILYGPQHLGLPLNYQHGWHSENRLKKELPPKWAEALRASMGFLIPFEFHHVTSPIGYHNAIHEGPRFPTEMDEVFEKVGLGVSHVVSRLSINLTSVPGEAIITQLNNRQHRFISNPSRAYPERAYHGEPYRQQSRDKIGRFYAEYAITKQLEEGALSPIEEEVLFDTRQPLTRELGSLLYRSTIESLND